MWAYNDSDMTLSNKKFGVQSYQWLIPLEEEDGIIEKINSKRVLAFRRHKKNCTPGKISILRRRKQTRSCGNTSDHEVWMRSKNNQEGFFTLKNKATGQLLTQMEEKGRTWKKYQMKGTHHEFWFRQGTDKIRLQKKYFVTLS